MAILRKTNDTKSWFDFIKKQNFFLGLRVSAWFEMLLFFVIVLLISFLAGSSDRFFYVSPQPFWIIVLLMSVQYGTKEGVVAALLSSFILLFYNLPPQSIIEDRFQYFMVILKNPILWFIAAVVIGEVRMRQLRERKSLVERAVEAEDREKTVAKSYDSLKGIKEALEVRIAGEMHTAIKAYEGFRQLEATTKDKLFEACMQLVGDLTSPSKFSVYDLDSDLKLVGFEGWSSEDKFSQTFSSTSDVFSEIVGKRATLSVVNKEHRKILAGEGYVAAPIINLATNQVFGMIKIEEISFILLKGTIIETLKLIGEWTGSSFGSRLSLERAKETSYINPDNMLFSPSYFDYQKQYIVALGRRLGFDVSLLRISLLNPEKVPESEKAEIAVSIKKAVTNSLRKIDQPFDFEAKGSEWGILLAGTSSENARIVLKKIQDQLDGAQLTTESLVYSIMVLNEKSA